MPKKTKYYECENCGYQSPRWEGRCLQCGEWNTFIENNQSSTKTKGSAGNNSQAVKTLNISKISGQNMLRQMTNIGEFDRVLGGGFIPGSITLLAGNPGIGKSTLILQILEKLNLDTLYVSGEESSYQIKNRADRLNLALSKVQYTESNSVENIINFMAGNKTKFVVIDSIQTIWADEIDGAQGSVNQIKASAGKLMEAAKRLDISVIIVGHVTKDGMVSGPRTLEHIVDTVIYLEGDKYHDFRIIRATKNRFGSTNEVGIFEMGSKGFAEVVNPSKAFLKERKGDGIGSIITAVMEGTRPILVEVQALTSLSSFGYPKRTASGIDFNRLSLLSAVLSRKADINLSNQDIYVNIVGGIAIKEPSVDLSVCLAIASSFLKKPILQDLVAIGEVGLSGEVRSVTKLRERIMEAKKLGYKNIICSESITVPGIQVLRVDTLREALKKAFK